MDRPTYPPQFKMTTQEYKVKAMLLGGGLWYSKEYHMFCDVEVKHCYDPDTMELLIDETTKSVPEFQKFIYARAKQFDGYQRR